MLHNYSIQVKFKRHISQSEIRNSAAAEKSESESEGGQKFLPPNPLPFCPPERLDFKIRNSDFRQKMFEHQSENTAKNHISKNQGWKPRRVAPRLFLTISQKVKIGGGSEIRTRDTLSDIPPFQGGPFDRSGIPPSFYLCTLTKSTGLRACASNRRFAEPRRAR